MAENGEFLSSRRVANILMAAFGALCLTATGWIMARLNSLDSEIMDLKIEVVKTQAEVDQLRGDQAVDRDEIHGLFKLNAQHDLDPPKKK